MPWNWQQPDWPNFTWKRDPLVQAERQFLVGAGTLAGAVRHLGGDERARITMEALGNEAITTSEIEGEILDRASVQSSIRRRFGLQADKKRAAPAEEGIAEMTVDLYRSFAAPLSSKMLFSWHEMVLRGRRDLKDIGPYRTSREPMQVVSGSAGRFKVHFEAPPSSRVKTEMRRFIDWFNNPHSPAKAEPLPPLTRAGIAHLYFETIHPFEDGNGRLGRALAEKCLAQGLGQPTITALAATILARRKNYYDALAAASKKNEITEWLVWFADTVIEAQKRTTALIEFSIEKTKMLDRLRDQLNRRQMKAVLRMLREGPEGFSGGLSAGKYSTITGASPATTTRDLADLVEKGVLLRSGELKHTRYRLLVAPN